MAINSFGVVTDKVHEDLEAAGNLNMHGLQSAAIAEYKKWVEDNPLESGAMCEEVRFEIGMDYMPINPKYCLAYLQSDLSLAEPNDPEQAIMATVDADGICTDGIMPDAWGIIRLNIRDVLRAVMEKWHEEAV